WLLRSSGPQEIKHSHGHHQNDGNGHGVGRESEPVELRGRRVGKANLVPVSKSAAGAREAESRNGNRGQEQTPADGVASGSRSDFCHRRSSTAKADVQVHDLERIVLDEFAARFHVFAHQRRENVFCRDGVFQFHLEQRARLRVHGGFPELRGIHFAQALKPRDGEIFFRVFHHVAKHVLRSFLGGLVAVARNDKGRLVEFFDLLCQRAQALVFRGGGERPIDLLVVRRAELDFVKADRKSTRLNSSHGSISYAVFCLKKKNTNRYIFHRAAVSEVLEASPYRH